MTAANKALGLLDLWGTGSEVEILSEDEGDCGRERERECERERERERQVDLPLPCGGALEGGPPGLLLLAASLLGGRPFEWGEA